MGRIFFTAWLFVIVAKFGDHALRRLVSSLSNVIRQEDKNSSLGDFFRIYYLAFDNYLFNSKLSLALAVPRLFCECAFLCVRYS